MASIADNQYGGRFKDATFVAFASPNINNHNGILNIGFENDPIYKLINGYADNASTVDNFVAANAEYMSGNIDGRNPWSMGAHDGDLVFEIFSRLSQSSYYHLMGPDSVLVFDDSAGLVQDKAADRANTGAFYLGQSVGDTISGRDGADYIEGFGGNDFLSGGAANDIISGGIGNDNLNGGSGADTFVFLANFGRDLIEDFIPAQDYLEISRSVFADFNALYAHATTDGLGNIVVAADANNTITLEDVTIQQLLQYQSHLSFV
jgi:Ca2+-binding RTX toxin-like protein